MQQIHYHTQKPLVQLTPLPQIPWLALDESVCKGRKHKEYYRREGKTKRGLGEKNEIYTLQTNN